MVDIDNTHLCNSGKCYDLRNQLTSEVAKYQEKENIKNECDHIVGICYDSRDPISILKSDKKNYPDEYYRFCPECGAKLNEN